MRERHCRHRRRQQQQNSPDIIHTVTSIITFILVIYTISNTSISSIRYTSYTTITTRFISVIYPLFRRVKDGIITTTATTTTIPFVVGFSYKNHLRKYRYYHFTFDRKIKNHLLIFPTYQHFTMSKNSISTSLEWNIKKINDDDNTSGENNDGIDVVVEEQQQQQLGQPIYITIGPPCSGKTTWIQKRNQLFNDGCKILDICIDEQPGVYYSIPIEYFLPPNNKNNQITNNQSNGNNYKNDTNIDGNDNMEKTITTILPTDIIFEKTIYERIQEQKEVCTIIQRFQNIISKDEFYKSIVRSSSSSSSSILYQVVEDIISEYQNDNNQNSTLPKQIDLFVFESIFQRCTLTLSSSLSSNESIIEESLSGIERTKQLLYNTSSSIPIAWGNTNTRPNDYVEALKLASLLHRPVYFVVYYDDDFCDTKHKLDLFDLSVENGLYGLIRRNIFRFLKTGRDVPMNIIIDMRDRVNQMIHNALTLPNEGDNDAELQRNMTKFEFHKRLVQLAGYHMNDDRTVTLVVQEKKSTSKPIRKALNQQLNIVQHDKKSIDSSHKRPRNVQEEEQKHHVATATTTMKRRPWDRPSSAVRRYNGQLDNQQSKIPHKNNSKNNSNEDV